ncbi:MAG: DUF998 domain-containing protein [Xanthomonadales bacterium]|nr:DUF998 domain-containing protein [Xanthomonadales bacterium]
MFRLLAMAALSWFIFAFILLHIVRTDLTLWHTTLSIYAVGPADWVLTIGFYAIALVQGMIACHGIEQRHSWRDYVVSGLLLLAALGAVLVAVFPYTIKLPHNTGAVLQLGLFPISLSLRTVWFRERSLRKTNTLLAVISMSCFLLLLLANPMRNLPFYSFGFIQKLEIICITLWLLCYSAVAFKRAGE